MFLCSSREHFLFNLETEILMGCLQKTGYMNAAAPAADNDDDDFTWTVD